MRACRPRSFMRLSNALNCRDSLASWRTKSCTEDMSQIRLSAAIAHLADDMCSFAP